MKPLQMLCRGLAGLLACAPVIAPAAADPAALPGEPVRLALIAAGPLQAGLQVRLAPGWKFYWRNPGEGGVPPRFDWSASRNLAAAAVAWPAPRRITIGTADLHGYTGEVVLPVALTPERSGEAIAVNLLLEYGICKDICILREDRLTRTIQPDAPVDSAAAVLLARWQARVPRAAQEAGVTLASRQAAPGRLTIRLAGPRPFERPDLFIEGAPEAWFGRPEVSLSADGREARFVIPVQPAGAASDLPITMTLTDKGLALELTVAE